MSKSLRAAITQLIKDDFKNDDIEVKDLKVSFKVVEQTETPYEMADEPNKKRGPKPGKRRGRKPGSKNKPKQKMDDTPHREPLLG